MKKLLCLLMLSGCSQTQIATALQSPVGQLFCAIDLDGGGQIVVAAVDSSSGGLAVLATNAAASVVQADCQAAAKAVGGVAGVPVVPPTAAVASVAIVSPPGTIVAGK